MSSTPSYLTRNRFGVYVLQVRIPVHIRHNRNLIQRSLRTRNRREALRRARRAITWLECRDFDSHGLDTIMGKLHNDGTLPEGAFYYDAGNDGELFNLRNGIPPPQAPQPAYNDKEDPTLDVLYEKWLTSDVASMARSSKSEYKRMVGFFLQVITELNGGTLPRVSQLTKEMIRDYKEVVRKTPSGVRPKGKTIAQLKTAEGDKKSDKTIKGIFVNVGTFIHWINDEAYPINSELHSALTRHKVPKGQGKRRRPFDDVDLIALFNSDEYRLGKWKRASDFWVPLIALFTGMTRNEIIQLEVEDVYKKYGHYVIDVNDRGDKKLKVSASLDDEEEGSTGRPRIIPLHPQLMQLGFLDFVDHRKRGRLFPCEERNSRGQFGAYGNRFRNYRNRVGAGPRHEKEFRDFHSFRHLMKTRLRDEVKDDGIIDDILGHSSKLRSTVGRTYDHSDRLKFKAEAVKKLKHDCIDFDSIRDWKHHRFA